MASMPAVHAGAQHLSRTECALQGGAEDFLNGSWDMATSDFKVRTVCLFLGKVSWQERLVESDLPEGDDSSRSDSKFVQTRNQLNLGKVS